ncbi:MAG TPA: thioredoxin [Patescibacteria group bacterium]
MADIVITDQNFQDKVLKAEKPVLVDFWAPWCGPCKIIGPIVEELAKEYEGKLVVGKVNVDENANTAGAYGIMSIPTLAFFKKGQVVKTVIGAQPKESLKKVIDEVLA